MFYLDQCSNRRQLNQLAKQHRCGSGDWIDYVVKESIKQIDYIAKTVKNDSSSYAIGELVLISMATIYSL